MRIALKIALVPVAAFTLTGCTAVTEGAPSPEPTVVVTQYTPAPEGTPEPLSDVEIALATQVREAAVDDLNRWSDREIIGVSWFICEQLDFGTTMFELTDALQQNRFNDAMVAAFVEPSVTVLCPEHVDKLGEGAV
ncbi:hypothetical protein RS84_01406 [Microbacterium hydrocarbonoxydans]|uniref:DUF732 domain-containing protein n=1 Tax=Microbacterium hydrocarbonoxydans TaxID=273678 RepID=A0A0M2HTJ8_9MICO|nr:DUF732 domain-containing protein [Microbacterium hydrocarbonoxydans]KJL47778.1 hypothetical protein RS84_01406 [Microbacterium hydrocarbonoxydans]